MRSAGNNSVGSAAHLFQLRHQIGLGMKTSRRVNNHIIAVARSSGLQSIVEHSSRIASGLGANYFGSGAFTPDLELLDGSGTKSVGRALQNRLAIGAEH